MAGIVSRTILFTFAASGAACPVLAQQGQPAGAGDGDIVVTAQRRDEKLSQVPMSVSALGGADLTRKVVVSTQDLTSVVPGLLWGRSTTFNQPTIRGVGSRNASSGDEPNVATFIDGVYQPDSVGTLYELANIERIEVLKGPQGTLFGRNATGGAISVTTRKPSFDWTGSLSASYGRFDYYKLTGYVSGPIVSDVVAASLSAAKYGDDGYIENIHLHRKQGENDGTVLRGKILIQPTPDLHFEINGLYSKTSNTVLTSPYALNGNSQARARLGNPAFNPDGLTADHVIADKPYTTASAFVPDSRVNQRMGDAHMQWDLGFATLSGLLSIARTRANTLYLTEASPFALSQTYYVSTTKSKNEELVLTSPGNRMLTWLVGVTGFQANAKFDPLISTGRNATTGVATPATILYGQNTRAFAVFGEATVEPTDGLFLTGGLRYNRDRKTAFNVTGTQARVGGSKVFSNVSPRAVIRYEFAQNANVYASYTKGFKSGTYNAVGQVGAQLPASPETIDAYEVGLKAEPVRGVRLELSAYHYDYKDLQVSTAVVLGNPPVSATTVQNAGRAKIGGIEASVDARITNHFRVNAGLSWIPRARIYDFPNAIVQLPVTVGGVPTGTGNVNTTIVADGKRLIRAPRETLTIGANYDHELLGGDLNLNVNAFFSAKYYADLANSVSQRHYEVVNGSATWRAQKGKGFYGTVFVQNLTNQKYAVGYLISTFITATQVNKPRWFGVTLGYDF